VFFYPLETEDLIPQCEDLLVAELEEEILHSRSIAIQNGLVQFENTPRPSRFVAKLRNLHPRWRAFRASPTLDKLFHAIRQTVVVAERESGMLDIGLLEKKWAVVFNPMMFNVLKVEGMSTLNSPEAIDGRNPA
jgi:hypothetical protein